MPTATATATAAGPTMTAERRAAMERYMHDCRRVRELGVMCWEGPAPGQPGPRILNPEHPADRALIESMFSDPPEQPVTPAPS